MISLINNTSNLVKAVAVYIVVTAYTGALIIVGIDLITGKSVPDPVWGFLASSLGLALPALGLVHGTGLVNSDTAAAIKSLAAQVNAQSTPQAIPVPPPPPVTITPPQGG